MTVAVILASALVSAFGTSGKPVELWPEGRMPSVQTNQVRKPFMVWFEPKELTSKAIVISVSGGGYKGNGIDGDEVVPIRDYLLKRGVTVVTMLYRTPRPVGLPKHLTAWQDAQRTVRLVRREAKRRGLDPDRIGFTGCSAGGHLALMAAVSSRTPAYAPVDAADDEPCNVDFAIPVYPAYVLSDGLDRHNEKKGNDLSDGFAPELKFDEATPPMCFFHGDADGWSAMGSVRAYHMLRTMGIPAELHVMALEGHCFQFNPRPGTPAWNWKDVAWQWLVSMDIVTDRPPVWSSAWRAAFPLWSDPLEKQATFASGTWTKEHWGGAIIRAVKPGNLTVAAREGETAIDFEYRLDGDAAAAVAVGSEETVLKKPAAAHGWGRMTLPLGGAKFVVFSSLKDGKGFCLRNVRLGREAK